MTQWNETNANIYIFFWNIMISHNRLFESRREWVFVPYKKRKEKEKEDVMMEDAVQIMLLSYFAYSASEWVKYSTVEEKLVLRHTPVALW